MYVTLGEAARQSGISKSTISRAIRDGKLSAERSADTGSYKIEQSELARYLEATAVTRATAENSATAQLPTQVTTPAERPETAALEAQIDGLKQVAELLRQQLSDSKEQSRRELDDVRAQRDHWQRQAERLAALPAPKQPETPMTWWRWLRTTG